MRIMKKTTLSLAVGSSLLMAFALNLRAATIGFDDLADGTVVGNQYLGQGVGFSTHAFHDPTVGDNLTYYASWGNGQNGVLVLDSYCNYPEYIRADFSVPVNSVSVDITPFEGGANYTHYSLGLVLYNSSGGVLGGFIQDATYSGGVTPYTLDASALTSDVAYAEFFGYYGAGGGGVNAVTFDNFTFGTAAAPDGGTTMLLLGSALMGLEGLRRKLRK